MLKTVLFPPWYLQLECIQIVYHSKSAGSPTLFMYWLHSTVDLIPHNFHSHKDQDKLLAILLYPLSQCKKKKSMGTDGYIFPWVGKEREVLSNHQKRLH